VLIICLIVAVLLIIRRRKKNERVRKEVDDAIEVKTMSGTDYTALKPTTNTKKTTGPSATIENIEILHKLGAGNFGDVFKGI
jgi:hypothetical protein